VVPGPGRFDGGGEGQQVVLARNLIDGLDNGPNLGRALAHFGHFAGGHPHFIAHRFQTAHIFRHVLNGLGHLRG
jgi:hypothetical protein